MSASPLHAALRAATADQHEAVETEARVEARLRDRDSRPGMVAALLALHRAVEHGLEPWRKDLDRAGYPAPARADLIGEGLAELGGQPSSEASHLMPANFGEALGWLYVAEGSMLGGRVMRKAMVADGISLDGLRFLDPYPGETGTRWQAFMAVMESECGAGRAARADILKGGRDAFDLARRLLVSPRPQESF